jgi:DNA mismatch repair protein MutS
MVFLYRIMEGGTDRSYGIQVAKLAGLPPEVVERAKQILWQLERNSERRQQLPRQEERLQLTLFEPAAPSALTKEVQSLDLDQLTPLSALEKLYELKNLASQEEDKTGRDE